MAASSCVRDETRSKTYGKIGIEERRNEEVKHVRGMMIKQVTKEWRTIGGGHVEKS